MTDMANAIMDAAERRIRLGGFGGFSFREIASDVGVKSSSVHYHFPTKENLVAAVVNRYSDWVVEQIDKGMAVEADPIKVWTAAFRTNLHSKALMCPATVLGAGRHDLPPEVAEAVTRFFQMCRLKLVESGLKAKEADAFLAEITGALVVATALNDPNYYDTATAAVLDSRAKKAA